MVLLGVYGAPQVSNSLSHPRCSVRKEPAAWAVELAGVDGALAAWLAGTQFIHHCSQYRAVSVTKKASRSVREGRREDAKFFPRGKKKKRSFLTFPFSLFSSLSLSLVENKDG